MSFTLIAVVGGVMLVCVVIWLLADHSGPKHGPP